METPTPKVDDGDAGEGGETAQQPPPAVRVVLSPQQVGVLLMLLDRVPLEGVEAKIRAAEAQAALLRGLQVAQRG